MKLRKINNKGFSHVEMVIVVLVVAVLGLVGWRVLKNTSHAGSWFDMTNNKGLDEYGYEYGTNRKVLLSRIDAQVCVQKPADKYSPYLVKFNLFSENKYAETTKTPLISSIDYKVTGTKINGNNVTWGKVTNASLSPLLYKDTYQPNLYLNYGNFTDFNMASDSSSWNNANSWMKTGNGNQKVYRGYFAIDQGKYTDLVKNNKATIMLYNISNMNGDIGMSYNTVMGNIVPTNDIAIKLAQKYISPPSWLSLSQFQEKGSAIQENRSAMNGDINNKNIYNGDVNNFDLWLYRVFYPTDRWEIPLSKLPPC